MITASVTGARARPHPAGDPCESTAITPARRLGRLHGNGNYQVFCSRPTSMCDYPAGDTPDYPSTDITSVDTNQGSNPCMKKPTTVPSCADGDEKCGVTGNGARYRGHQTTTINGHTCRQWSARGLSGHNYCRNPDPRLDFNAAEAGYLWCWYGSAGGDWDYCFPKSGMGIAVGGRWHGAAWGATGFHQRWVDTNSWSSGPTFNRRRRGTSFEDPAEDCYEWGDEEYSMKIWYRVLNVGTWIGHPGSCLTCDADDEDSCAAASYWRSKYSMMIEHYRRDQLYLSAAGTHSRGVVDVEMEAWEDDRGDRCSYDSDGAGDDCHEKDSMRVHLSHSSKAPWMCADTSSGSPCRAGQSGVFQIPPWYPERYLTGVTKYRTHNDEVKTVACTRSGSTWYGRSNTPAKQVTWRWNELPTGPSDWLHSPVGAVHCDPEYLFGMPYNRMGGMMSDDYMWETSKSRKPHGALIFNTFYDI